MNNTLRLKNRVGKLVLPVLSCVGILSSPLLYADEGGTSFWLPGQYGSLAATPAEPGWSLGMIYYHAPTDAGADKTFTTGERITAGLDVGQDLLMIAPTYTFSDPVWGGQAAISVAAVYGRVDVGISATLTGSDGSILSGSQSEALTAFGDLFPTLSLRWNNGNHNTMVYTAFGIPVGSYRADRLSNIGSNHWAADIGAGYTYFNATSGLEFSATAGITYNFENPDTDYKNGLDLHLDWGASQFISEQTHVGLVGYFYHQITGDSGAGATLGDFKSRVDAIGPQLGHIFMMGEKQVYVNVKGYWEFNAKHRPEGWNGWLTLSVPLGSGS